MAYFALAQSHFRYDILCWGTALTTYISPLKVIQKRFLKVLLNKNQRYPTELLFKEAKVLDLRQLYYLNMAIEVVRDETNELSQINHIYGTRRRYPYLAPRTASVKAHRSRAYMSAKIINSLPEELRFITKPEQMKKLPKRKIISSKRVIMEEFIERDAVVVFDLWTS
ncbi:hypothetical protein HHI36_009867 [Cryptolaemus montrouzieri]|uniref:Uncharacterized protein n=1 Tax=Cryptolaemus montrouzieri TaxID=559131 RepID=A0ABD2MH01_9CUCU